MPTARAVVHVAHTPAPITAMAGGAPTTSTTTSITTLAVPPARTVVHVAHASSAFATAAPTAPGATTITAAPSPTSTELDLHFTPDQQSEFAQFLGANSVQPSSQVAYRRGVALWQEYLAQIPEALRPDELLCNTSDDRTKALHIFAFSLFLYRAKRWRGIQITTHFAAIGHHLRAAGNAFMEHAIIASTRAAVSMSQPERAVEMQRRIDTAIMPMTYPMIDWARGTSGTGAPGTRTRGGRARSPT